MITLYGLKTCDTCRKARQTAEKAGKTVTFVDVRETPLSEADLARFLADHRKSATWRNLSETERQADPKTLLRTHPTLMKRPVIEGASLTLGWSDKVQATHLG